MKKSNTEDNNELLTDPSLRPLTEWLYEKKDPDFHHELRRRTRELKRLMPDQSYKDFLALCVKHGSIDDILKDETYLTAEEILCIKTFLID